VIVSGNRGQRQRSQFEALSVVYDRFNVELAKSAYAPALELERNWIAAREKFSGWLSDPNAQITRSMLVQGLKQGLRDLLLVMNGWPLEYRQSLIRALRQITEGELPAYFSQESQKLARIVGRGRVRSEAEYYLVRHRVDEIEGLEANISEVDTLLKLLDQFEAKHPSRK
jgi:hypothetical protein